MSRFLAIVAVVCLLVSACGNDDSTANGPAATEAPATAPEPTAAPEPDQPAASIDTLVFDENTTGGDVTERLTNAERETAHKRPLAMTLDF